MEVGSEHNERVDKWLFIFAEKIKGSLLEEVMSELGFGGRIWILGQVNWDKTEISHAEQHKGMVSRDRIVCRGNCR